MNSLLAPTRWSLQALLAAPEGEPLEACLAQLEQAVSFLEAARPLLSPHLAETDFLNLLQRYETMSCLAHRLGAYAALWFAADTQNQAALNLQSRLDERLADANNRTMFFTLWFKDLPDEAATRLMQASGRRRYFCESLRRFQPYTLSEAEEQIIALKDVNGIDALLTLYDMITSKFVFTLEIAGEQRKLTRDELTAYFRDPAPALRAAAYRELYRVYLENSTVLVQIYQHRVRDWNSEGLQLRHYPTPITARNVANDIPDQVTDTLLAVSRRNNGLFQHYFKLKAKWLGLGKLRRYDIYAPLTEAETTYSYAEAIELVMSSFRGFSPVLADQAQRVIAEGHLDSEARPGKRGGAFCMAVLPGLAPWVLTNFAGRARDVATLAHELGHAVHALLAAEHSILTFEAALPLAETASVFSEMLLTERLLQAETNHTLRRSLLAYAIDDAYATVQRQAYITLFERDAHRLIIEGKTPDELAAHYLAGLTEQFGDAAELSDEFKWEWLMIPHIYQAPFYTYAYSFGQLLVLALYRQYQIEGAAFVPKYLKILSYGGSAAPARILAEAGIDMTSPVFWQGGFDVLADLIHELEGLEGASA
jgi:oligoendopeptidase F